MHRLVALAAFAVAAAAFLPTASARLAMAPIGAVIRDASPRFASCAAASVGPPGDYRLTLAFTIEATGRVSDAEIRRSELPDAATAECFRQVVLGLVFPSVTGSSRVGLVRVSYPWLVHID